MATSAQGKCEKIGANKTSPLCPRKADLKSTALEQLMLPIGLFASTLPELFREAERHLSPLAF